MPIPPEIFSPVSRIVAIETSGRQGSVAIALGPTLLAQRELPAAMRHAAELMPAIRDLTRQQGWAPNQIDHVYLSLGPGSFTGLRIAVAIARALHQASGCRLVGVPSLEVIGQNAPPDFAIALPLLDAKRTQIFSARFERINGTLLQTVPPALVDPQIFLQQALVRAQSLSPSAPVKIALLGEGLDYHREALFRTPMPPNIQLVELDRTLWAGQAIAVHALGYQSALANRFSDPATLLPLYIRLPEAEEVYRKKHGLPITDPAV